MARQVERTILLLLLLPFLLLASPLSDMENQSSDAAAHSSNINAYQYPLPHQFRQNMMRQLPPVGAPTNQPQMAYEAPNGFYMNSPFNKGTAGYGFQGGPGQGGAGEVVVVQGGSEHTALGEIFASKMELLPSILKTGFFVAVLVLVFKLIASCFTAFSPAIAHFKVKVADAPADPAAGSSDKKVVDGRSKRAAPLLQAKGSDLDAMKDQLETILGKLHDFYSNY